jgi:hypothetical protein
MGSFGLTSRLLTFTLGMTNFKKIIADFCKNSSPKLFATDEGEEFLRYIENLKLDVQYLNDVMAFERAVHASLVDGSIKNVRFNNDAYYILNSLVENRKPEFAPKVKSEIELTPDMIKNFVT